MKPQHEHRVVSDLPWLVPRHLEEARRQAKAVAGTSYAWVTFIQGEELYIVCGEDSDPAHVPRDISLCQYVYRTPTGRFAVSDARQDARWLENPLVQGPYQLTSYAGVAIRSPRDGRVLGVLAVGDTAVWSPDAIVLQVMTAFADLLGHQLDPATSDTVVPALPEPLWVSHAGVVEGMFLWRPDGTALVRRALHERTGIADGFGLLSMLFPQVELASATRSTLAGRLEEVHRGRQWRFDENVALRTPAARWVRVEASRRGHLVLGTMRDVTRDVTMRAMVTSPTGERTLLPSLFSAAREPLVVVRSQGQITGANPAARHLAAGAAHLADLVGREVADTVVRQVLPRIEPTGCLEWPISWRSAEGALVKGRMQVVRHQAGERYSVSFPGGFLPKDCTPVSDEGSSGRDLLALLHHELRTPLTAMLGSLELMHELGSSSWEDLTPVLLEGTKTLTRQVSQLLAAAEVLSGPLAVTATEVEIAGLLAAEQPAAAAAAEARGVRLVWQGLPSDTGVMVTDPRLLGMSLRGLVLGMVERTLAGGVVEVAATLQRGTAVSQVVVRITRRGEAEAGHPPVSIEQEASQVHHGHGHGTGLHWSTARRCVATLGGNLTETGHGETATLVVPVADPRG